MNAKEFLENQPYRLPTISMNGKRFIHLDEVSELMERYAYQNKVKENELLHDVSNQRELLIALMEFAIDKPEIPEYSTIELVVDDFIKRNS